jgi:hypothetical protein
MNNTPKSFYVLYPKDKKIKDTLNAIKIILLYIVQKYQQAVYLTVLHIRRHYFCVPLYLYIYNDNEIKIPGFHFVDGSNRKKHKKARRNSGGINTLFSKGIKKLPNPSLHLLVS